MKKRILFIVFTVAMMLSLLVVSASAAAEVASGTCGDDLTWVLDEDGTLTISGTGTMTNWSSSSSIPWYSYQSSITAVVIEDGVTSIGNNAFKYCSNLTNIAISNSVTRIGSYTFCDCTSLTSITIPDNVTSISSYAFSCCSSLTSVTIPDNVTSIDVGAFFNDASLMEIQVSTDNPMYSSADGALFNKDLTELICYPGGKTTVSYEIPDSVTTIDASAFYGCAGLTSVTIPGGVTSIGNSTFYNCTGLAHVEIPNSVTSIGNSVFRGCSSLTSVTIPDSITSIGSYMFCDCTGLTSIVIPDSVTNIGSNVFTYCTSLTEIQVSEGNTAYCSVDGVLFNKDITELICFPAGKATTSYTIPNSVTIIGNYAFAYCANLTSVTISDSVVTIGMSAFNSCKGLVSVELPSNVTSIGSSAFSICTSLVNVTIPDGVESIESAAFVSCTSLTAVVIPTSVIDISSSAFNLCSNLSDIYYGGTEEAWSNVSIGSSNAYWDSATIHYNSVSFLLGYVNLRKLSITSSGVALTWNKAAYAEGYYIYRSADEEETYQLIATVSDASTLNYTDAEVEDGVTYSYYVQAYVGGTTGSYSGKYITYLASTVTEVDDLTPEATNHTGDQNYSTYASTVKSYLTETENGLMRVEYTNGQIVVEYYDSNYTLTEKKIIKCELSRFGGFYAGEDAYYLVFGQDNLDEDNSVEVIRVVQYSTDWERQGQASLYGANTRVPFNGGSCRMTEYDGYLYIRTCHTMYKSSDGLSHQANMTIDVQESTMEIKDTHCTVTLYGSGYVSHSFNQFVLVDDAENLILLDHGDASPRAAALTQCLTKAGSSSMGTSYKRVNLYSFEGDTGENSTGASLGGLEYSSTSYLAVGNSVTQDDDWDSHTARNVFVTVTDRDDVSSNGTTIHWITDYDTDGSISASTPQLVKLDTDAFLLLWTTTEYLDSCISYSRQTKLHYVYLDGEGNTTSDIYTVDGQLSDCQPIVSNGSVIWYVTGDANGTSKNTTPYFYSIDADGTYTVLCDGLAMPAFAVSAASNGLEISWESVDGAEGYAVYYGTGSSRASTTVEGEDTTSVTITVTDTSSQTYVIWVEAYSGGNKSLAQNKILFLYIPAPNVTLASSSTGIQISWSAVTEADEYAIYRKTTDSDYNLLGTTGDTAWTDSDVVSGTTYTYQVYALYGDVSSGGSTEKSLTWLDTLISVSAENTSSGLLVTWNTIGGSTLYRVYYAHDNVSGYRSFTAGDESTQSVILSLTSGTNYAIYVVAYADGSPCAASEVITILVEDVEVDPGPTEPDPTEPTDPEPTEPTDPGPTEENPFTDVNTGHYFYNAVLWAVDSGITSGTTETTFSPFLTAERCQVVTFLWRAAGCPEVAEGTENPFTDVSESDYFYTAVLWAVENGITSGTSATTFSPFAKCERCQVVTFLYRYFGEPEVTTSENPFTDVDTDDYFYNAVLWAVENGITSGTTETTFGPFVTCERCMIVTFLYRALGE